MEWVRSTLSVLGRPTLSGLDRSTLSVLQLDDFGRLFAFRALLDIKFDCLAFI